MDVAQVERLIDEAGEDCVPLVSALVAMYGDGLARIVGSLAADEVARLAEDPTVAQLLILHDLHPVSADNRVREAIAATGAYAVVEGVEGGVAYLRSADDGRRQVIEEAIARAAPDVDRVEFAEDPQTLLVLPQVGG